MKERYLFGSLIFGLLVMWIGILVFDSLWGFVGFIPWAIILVLHWMDMSSEKKSTGKGAKK